MKLTEILFDEEAEGVLYKWVLRKGDHYSSCVWLTPTEDLTGAPSVVEAAFDCSGKNLSSLAGGPKVVDDGYNCRDNKLKNLKGIATELYGDVDCSGNLISTFEYCPPRIYGNFNMCDNKIESLVGIADHIRQVDGDLMLSGNNIKEGGLGLLDIEYLGNVTYTDSDDFSKALSIILNFRRTRGTVYECQKALVDAGLEVYAQI